MEKVKTNLAALLKVKTIVTLLLTIVFCALALTGVISGADFLTVFTVVIAFYFGTQSEKNATTTYPGPTEGATGTVAIPAVTYTESTVDSATANEVHPPDSDEVNPIGFAR